jgi:hypothetical protein
MQLSPIHQLIQLLQHSLTALHCEISSHEAEKIGFFIFLAMESPQRKYHNSRHVLDVCKNMTSLQTLAGLFHDVVYYQIDKDFPPNTAELFAPFVELQNGEIFIRATAPEQQTFEICLLVFGLQRGQKLEISKGQNEFLSALIGGFFLDKYLTIKQLISFFVCIEATIPFRKPDAQGMTSYHKVEFRLQAIAIEYDFCWTEAEITMLMQEAVGLANRDVANFAAKDVGKFLDGTWTLLPESHAQLWYGGVYSVQSYRMALSKIEFFFGILEVEAIFDQHNHFPNNKTYQKLLIQATQNLEIAQEYIGIKLLPLAIIEAAALLTGGDAPLSFFMGDVRQNKTKIKRAEDFLPPTKHIHTDITQKVYQLLEYGRATATSFDLQNSPLAAFIYKNIGATTCQEMLYWAKLFFKQEISALAFLQKTHFATTKNIIEACAMIAETRKEKLLLLLKQINAN